MTGSGWIRQDELDGWTRARDLQIGAWPYTVKIDEFRGDDGDQDTDLTIGPLPLHAGVLRDTARVLLDLAAQLADDG